jgi:heme A synthase
MKALAAFVAALFLLSACGGQSDSKTPLSLGAGSVATPAPITALRAAVQAYSKAYLAGEGATAHAILSTRCQVKMQPSDFAASAVKAKKKYGDVPIKTLSVQVSGSTAKATYTYSVKAIDQTDEPWVFENGKWHNDHC